LYFESERVSSNF